jgi:hypothetical protein
MPTATSRPNDQATNHEPRPPLPPMDTLDKTIISALAVSLATLIGFVTWNAADSPTGADHFGNTPPIEQKLDTTHDTEKWLL